MSLNVPGVTWGPICYCPEGGSVAHRHGTRDGIEWIAVIRPRFWEIGFAA